MLRTGMKKTVLAAVGFAVAIAVVMPIARATNNMADYTWMPLFMQKTVPPNILFIVDFSDAMLPAAYGTYPLSYNNAASYSSNYAGANLTGTVSDTFDSTKTYYGVFDPLRCYTYGNASPKGFGSPAAGPVSKLNNDVSKLCNASGTTPSTTTAPWDGNFLNWLAMRKTDVAKQVLIGGFAIPAGNTDGTADVLGGESTIGLNGSTNSCASTSKPCWRYVKFVRHDSLQGRIDTSLEAGDTGWTSSGQTAGPGQVTMSGTTVTGESGIGPAVFTQVFQVGDIIKIGSFVPKNVTVLTDDTHLTYGPTAFSPFITNATTYLLYTAKSGTFPGVVSVTANSTAITGASATTPTTFTTSFASGDGIQIKDNNNTSDPIQVVSPTPTSATSLTTLAAFAASTTKPYTIFKKTGAGSGVVTVTAGLNTVTGFAGAAGTTFNTTFVDGDAVIISSGTEAQTVATTPTTATSLTTNTAFSASSTGAAYSTKTRGSGVVTASGGPPASSNTTLTGTVVGQFTGLAVNDIIRVHTQIKAITSIASAGNNPPVLTTGAWGTGSDPAPSSDVWNGYNKVASASAPGTVSIIKNTKAVTGSSTTFTTTFSVGDIIEIIGGSGDYYTVTQIASVTSMTVDPAYRPNTSASGKSYNAFHAGTTAGAGAIDITSGSTTVAGSASSPGTNFTTDFAVGDAISVGTQVQVISAITSATSMTTYNNFTTLATAQPYNILKSTVAGGGAGPGTVTTSGTTTVTGVATATPTTFLSTFAVGDVIKVTASSEPQVIETITDDSHMTAAANFSTTASSSAYSAFATNGSTQAGTVTTSGTTALGSAALSATTFTTTFRVGDQIQIGAETHTITAIASNTSLTVDAAFTTNISPQAYFNVAQSLQGPGTVTNTAGSSSVTGTDTLFTTRFKVGESIKIGTETKVIATITDDTNLATTANFTSANTTAAYFGPDGIYFGMGEGSNTGTIFVNGDATPVPFDAANARQYAIQVDVNYQETAAYKKSRSTGFVQNLRGDSYRVAVMFTNSGSGKAGKIQQYFDGAFNSSDINGTRNQHTAEFAALAESTYEGLCYYSLTQGPCYNNTPANFVVGGSGATVGGSGDPFFFTCLTRDSSGACTQTISQTVTCCKSFILMISAGIPSSDGNSPDQQMPFGDLVGGADTKGVTTSTLDDVAYYGNRNDIRSDVANTQSVAFYSVNAMGGGTGATLLASAAKYGGFNDQNSNGLPDAGTQACTYPSGSNLGSGAGTSSPEWDTDKDCTPDTFFDASEGGDLQGKINDAIASILKRAASGTSVSVLATSSTGEGAIYQAYFLPDVAKADGTTDQVKWYGFTQGLFIDTFGNIREDSDHDARLVLDKDKIVSLSFNSTTGDVVVLRCPDADGDGKADTTTVGTGAADCKQVSLSDILPLWEAGARLAYTEPGSNCTAANAGRSGAAGCRRILTWIDRDNNHLVGAVDTGNTTASATAEVIQFTEDNKAALCPYLNGTAVSVANVATCSTSGSAGQIEAANLIKFHRGEDGVPLGLRDRSSAVKDPDTGAVAQRVWKYGDVVDSTPTVVGSPKERYDTIYGDSTYTTYFKQYKARRQVAYVGANDGMLHAFNAGFFTEGDDSTTTAVEHGFFSTTAPTGITAGHTSPPLGAELWAFIPQELLPHLKWYADKNYSHVAYVDLKPKVTDARIFCASDNPAAACVNGQPGAGTTHPGGWGTILIGGMRFGGSCGACSTGTNNGGPPMTVTADFGAVAGTETRTYYSSYFVLDITDPEQDPVLLWTFTDATLGLTASFPSIARVSPTDDAKTLNTHAKWFAVFGSGPTGYTGSSAQVAKFFVVDLATGPIYSADQTSGTAGQSSCVTTPCVVVNTASTTNLVRAFTTGDANSFMGDVITLDADLDFRVDVIYAGNDIKGTGVSGTPAFVGKMYRLTSPSPSGTSLPADANFSNWGIAAGASPCPSGGARCPTTLLANFSCSTSGCTGAKVVGPITAAATVSQDTLNNIWVFFGTGRFFSTSDKANTDTQYFFGVKDSCALDPGCAQTQRNNLVDVSSSAVCNPCATGTELSGVTGATTVSELGALINDPTQNIDGWFTTLPGSGERSLSTPTILGGTVFFTTFIPTSDICVAAGSGSLYALYYLTGTPYSSSTIGASGGTTNVITRSIALGTGLPSQMAVQIGSQGSGTSGSGGGGSGCAGRVTGYIQASTGVLGQVCGKPALSVYSRMVSWRDL